MKLASLLTSSFVLCASAPAASAQATIQVLGMSRGSSVWLTLPATGKKRVVTAADLGTPSSFPAISGVGSVCVDQGEVTVLSTASGTVTTYKRIASDAYRTCYRADVASANAPRTTSREWLRAKGDALVRWLKEHTRELLRDLPLKVFLKVLDIGTGWPVGDVVETLKALGETFFALRDAVSTCSERQALINADGTVAIAKLFEVFGAVLDKAAGTALDKALEPLKRRITAQISSALTKIARGLAKQLMMVGRSPLGHAIAAAVSASAGAASFGLGGLGYPAYYFIAFTALDLAIDVLVSALGDTLWAALGPTIVRGLGKVIDPVARRFLERTPRLKDALAQFRTCGGASPAAAQTRSAAGQTPSPALQPYGTTLRSASTYYVDATTANLVASLPSLPAGATVTVYARSALRCMVQAGPTKYGWVMCSSLTNQPR